MDCKLTPHSKPHELFSAYVVFKQWVIRNYILRSLSISLHALGSLVSACLRSLYVLCFFTIFILAFSLLSCFVHVAEWLLYSEEGLRCMKFVFCFNVLLY